MKFTKELNDSIMKYNSAEWKTLFVNGLQLPHVQLIEYDDLLNEFILWADEWTICAKVLLPFVYNMRASIEYKGDIFRVIDYGF